MLNFLKSLFTKKKFYGLFVFLASLVLVLSANAGSLSENINTKTSYADCNWIWTQKQHGGGVNISSQTPAGNVISTAIFSNGQSRENGFSQVLYEVGVGFFDPFISMIRTTVTDPDLYIGDFNDNFYTDTCVFGNYSGGLTGHVYSTKIGASAEGDYYLSQAGQLTLNGADYLYNYLLETGFKVAGPSPVVWTFGLDRNTNYSPSSSGSTENKVIKAINPFIVIYDSSGNKKAGPFISPTDDPIYFAEYDQTTPILGVYETSRSYSSEHKTQDLFGAPAVNESESENKTTGGYWDGNVSWDLRNPITAQNQLNDLRPVYIYGTVPFNPSLMGVTSEYRSDNLGLIYRAESTNFAKANLGNLTALKSALSSMTAGETAVSYKPVSANVPANTNYDISAFYEYDQNQSSVLSTLMSWAKQVPISFTKHTLNNVEIGEIVGDVTSCEVNVSPGETVVGGLVNWTVNPPATGNATYYWSGSESLNATGNQVSKSYAFNGPKYGQAVLKNSAGRVLAICNNSTEILNKLKTICVADPNLTPVGTSVKWTALPEGGQSPYQYDWDRDGYDDPQSFSESYNTSSNINKTVKVRDSAGRLAESSCNANVSEPLIVSCGVSYSGASVIAGSTVVRYVANVTGGNGLYAYNWSGSENLTGNTNKVSKIYNDPGTKRAIVTVSSGGRDVSAVCSTIAVSGSINASFDFSLTNDGNKAVTQGEEANSQINVNLLSGLSRQVNLVVSTGNEKITGTLNKVSSYPDDEVTLNLKTTIDIPIGVYPITITGTTPLPVQYFCKTKISAIQESASLVNYNVSCRPDQTFIIDDYLNSEYSATGILSFSDLSAQSEFFNAVVEGVANQVCGLNAGVPNWQISGSGFNCLSVPSVTRTTSFNLEVNNAPSVCEPPTNLVYKRDVGLCTPEVKLSWNNNNGGSDKGYKIFNGDNLVATINNGNTKTYTLNNQEPGYLLDLRVQSICPSRESLLSQSLSVLVPEPISAIALPPSGTVPTTVDWVGSHGILGGTAPYFYSWSGDVSGNTKSIADIAYTTSGYRSATFSVRDSAGLVCSKSTAVNIVDSPCQYNLSNSGDVTVEGGQSVNIDIYKTATSGSNCNLEIYQNSVETPLGLVSGNSSNPVTSDSATNISLNFVSGNNPEIVSNVAKTNTLRFSTSVNTPPGDYEVTISGNPGGSTSFIVTVETITPTPSLSWQRPFCKNGEADLYFTDLSQFGATSYKLYESGVANAIVLNSTNTTNVNGQKKYTVFKNPVPTGRGTYRVSAVYPWGESVLSNQVTVTTYPGCTCGAVPEFLTGSDLPSNIYFEATIPYNTWAGDQRFDWSMLDYSDRSLINETHTGTNLTNPILVDTDGTVVRGRATISRVGYSDPAFVTDFCDFIVSSTPPSPTTVEDNLATCRSAGNGKIDLKIRKQADLTGFKVFGVDLWSGDFLLNSLENRGQDSNYWYVRDEGLQWPGGTLYSGSSYSYRTVGLKGLIASEKSDPPISVNPSSCPLVTMDVSSVNKVPYNTSAQINFTANGVDDCVYTSTPIVSNWNNENFTSLSNVVSPTDDGSGYRNLSGSLNVTNLTERIYDFTQSCTREENNVTTDFGSRSDQLCVLPQEPTLVATKGDYSTRKIILTWNQTAITDSYVVKRGETEIATIEDCPGGVCVYEDLNLSPGWLYSYSVTSQNDCGDTISNTVYSQVPWDTLSVSCQVNPPSIQTGGFIEISALVLGGSGSTDHSFDVLNDGVSASPYVKNSTYLMIMNAVGNYNANVSVKSSDGQTAISQNCPFSVFPSNNYAFNNLKCNGVDGPLTVANGDDVSLSWTSFNLAPNSCTLSRSPSKTGFPDSGLPTSMAEGGYSDSVNENTTYTLSCVANSGISDPIPDSCSVVVAERPSINLEVKDKNGVWQSANSKVDTALVDLGSVEIRWLATKTNFDDNCSAIGNASGFSGGVVKDCSPGIWHTGSTIASEEGLYYLVRFVYIDSNFGTISDSVYFRVPSSDTSDFNLMVDPELIYLRTIGSATGRVAYSEPAEVTVTVNSPAFDREIDLSVDSILNGAGVDYLNDASIQISDPVLSPGEISSQIKISSADVNDPIPSGVYQVTILGDDGVDPKSVEITLIVENIAPGVEER